MSFSSNIPNIVTLLRIVLIPVLVLVFYLPFPWVRAVCAVFFTVAALTDLLDGYLARRLEQTSSLGTFLDPVADKLMVSITLILLVQADPTPLVAIPAAVIVGREIAISALREWMAAIGELSQVAVSTYGKLKTTAQMLAIILMLYQAPVGWLPVYETGLGLLYLAAALTLWSMFNYLRAAWPALNSH